MSVATADDENRELDQHGSWEKDHASEDDHHARAHPDRPTQMTDTLAKQFHEERKHEAELCFVSGMVGLWIWDYCTSIQFDFRLLTGRLPLRPMSVIYISMRFLLCVSLALFFVLQQHIVPINCGLLFKVSYPISMLTLAFAKATFAFRALSVWKYNPLIAAPLILLWTALVVGGTNQVRLINFVGTHEVFGWKCEPTQLESPSFAWFIGISIVLDLFIAALTVVRLFGTSKRHGWPVLQTIFRDAWIFGVLSILPCVSILLLLLYADTSSAMILCMPMAIILDVMLASRSYQSTFDAAYDMLRGQSSLDAKLLNGEILDADALRQLAFRLGGLPEVTPGTRDHTLTDRTYDNMRSRPRRRVLEDTYLPGQLSRVCFDTQPPFAAYRTPLECQRPSRVPAEEEVIASPCQSSGDSTLGKGSTTPSHTACHRWPSRTSLASSSRKQPKNRALRIGVDVSVDVDASDHPLPSSLPEARLLDVELQRFRSHPAL
ncbi:hypothetical protein V8E36_001288 [Tilletia maclaganii]